MGITFVIMVIIAIIAIISICTILWSTYKDMHKIERILLATHKILRSIEKSEDKETIFTKAEKALSELEKLRFGK